MHSARTAFASVGSDGVIPVDSPTVPKADSDSKSTWSSEYGVIRSSTKVAANTIVALMTSTPMAWRIVSWGMRRPNTSTSGLPRISAQIDSISSAKVVTRMPPAVEPEPPPMNISRSVSRRDSVVSWPTSSVAKPPDRGMIAANPAASTFVPTPSFPRVAGFDHSIVR